MSWIKRAIDRDKLRITNDGNCPYHNPHHRVDVPTKINACKRHSWVNKDWFDAWFAWFDARNK